MIKLNRKLPSIINTDGIPQELHVGMNMDKLNENQCQNLKQIVMYTDRWLQSRIGSVGHQFVVAVIQWDISAEPTGFCISCPSPKFCLRLETEWNLKSIIYLVSRPDTNLLQNKTNVEHNITYMEYNFLEQNFNTRHKTLIRRNDKITINVPTYYRLYKM